MVPKTRVRSFLKGSFETNSEEETFRLAQKVGRGLGPGAVVALVGEMGSGKTLFIKGLCRGLGVKDTDEVKSPTFVLLHLYQGRVPLYHFDLYRLNQEKELDTIGFEEFVTGRETVSLIEWADRAEGRIPPHAVWIELKITSPSSRQIEITRSDEKR